MINLYICSSSETKPLDLPENTVVYENDTYSYYLYKDGIFHKMNTKSDIITHKLLEFSKRYGIEDLQLMLEDDLKYGDEIQFERLIDYFQINILGFCGCASPENNIKYVRDSLALIKMLDEVRHDKSMTFEEWYAKELELFGSRRIANFMYYYLDSKELTEHGGSIPGWLDDKGYDLLEMLNMIDFEKEIINV